MRVAILTAESAQGNLITTRLVRRHPGTVCGILAARGVERGRSTWQSVLTLAPRVAPTFLAWKVAERVVSETAWRWLRSTSRPAAIPALADLARAAGIPLATTRDVNDDATRALLAGWRVDLAVSVHFTQRIAVGALATAPLGMLNVHGALLPRNRGLFPYFWELANGDAEAGVTVHWVNERLDTGDVVLQRHLPIAADETVGSLSWKGAEHGAALVIEALDALVAGRTLPRTAQPAVGASYFSWPTSRDVRALRARRRRLGSLAEAWQRIVGPAWRAVDEAYPSA